MNTKLGTIAQQGLFETTKGRLTLAGGLFVTMLLAYFARSFSAVLVADTAFLTDMGITGQPVQMGLVMSAFLAAYALANVGMGVLGDFMGPRKMMLLSVLLWVVSAVVGGFAGGLLMVLLSRVLLGVGEGMHWPMQSKLIKNWFPPLERGKANAAWLLGAMAGPALAIPFLAVTMADVGWRSTFFALAWLGLFPLAFVAFYVTDHPRNNPYISDEELAHIQAGLKPEKAAEQELRKEPFFAKIAVFANDFRFWMLTLNFTIMASIWWGIMAWLPSYFRVERHYSWTDMSVVSSMPYFLACVSVLLFGYLADKWGKNAPFLAFAQIGTAYFLYKAVTAGADSASALAMSLAIATLACGLPACCSFLQRILPSHVVGTGAGIMNGLANAVSAFVPMIMGYLIGTSGSYAGGLFFLIGLSLFGALLMVVLSLKEFRQYPSLIQE